MIAHFTGPLITEQIEHARWKTTQPFTFVAGETFIVSVGAGFETDMASVPAIAQGIIPRWGYWAQAAVVHDLLYYRHRNGLDSTFTRRDADRILLEGCKVKAADFGVPDRVRRDWLIYGAVVAGGIESWETPKERIARLKRNSTDRNIIDD